MSDKPALLGTGVAVPCTGTGFWTVKRKTLEKSGLINLVGVYRLIVSLVVRSLSAL